MTGEGISFNERKRLYIESVERDIAHPDSLWWQYPGPEYIRTDNYAIQNPETADIDETAVFRTHKKSWPILLIMLVVAGLLLSVLAEGKFGFYQLAVVTLLLFVVVPYFLDSSPRIIISADGIWLSKREEMIPWNCILLTYIKQEPGESISYFLVVHYFDENKDEFGKIEMELNGLVMPGLLAATIHKFKPKTYTGIS